MVGDSPRFDPSEGETVRVVGTVKWFNSVKGFGFLSPADGSRDVFLHLSCLRDAGFDSVDEGAVVTCEATKREKGLQAVRVLQIEPGAPGAASAAPRRSRPDNPNAGGEAKFAPVEAKGDFVGATVKWFNPIKGYGFVSCGDGQKDVFIHMEVLRRRGVSALQPGQTLRVKIGEGPKGQQVADMEPA